MCEGLYGFNKNHKNKWERNTPESRVGRVLQVCGLYYVWRQMVVFFFFYAIGVYSFSGSSLWILFCCFCGFTCALSVYILSMSVTVKLTNVYTGKKNASLWPIPCSFFFSELEKKKKWWFMNLWLGYVEALPTSLFCNVSVLWRCFDFWFDFFFLLPPLLF